MRIPRRSTDSALRELEIRVSGGIVTGFGEKLTLVGMARTHANISSIPCLDYIVKGLHLSK